jgi:hypothetical protein
VRFEKDLRRLRKDPRSQGAYLGVSVANAPVASEADFLWVLADRLLVGVVDLAVLRLGVRFEEIMRRFFACESASLAEGKSRLDALFTSVDDNEVVDLLPIPLRRV